MSSLDQLEPLIVPPPISAWPPAAGWWFLAALILTVVLMLRLKPWQRRHLEQAASGEAAIDPQRQAALDELAQLDKPYGGQPANQWLQQLNALLKRLCRTRYPDDNPHTLSGRAWLAFLDSRCPAAGLTRWMMLVEGVYRAECRLDDKAIQGLEHSVQIWIRKHV